MLVQKVANVNFQKLYDNILHLSAGSDISIYQMTFQLGYLQFQQVCQICVKLV